jgi:hypothetical protein
MWGRNYKIGIKCKGEGLRIRILEKMKEKYRKKMFLPNPFSL